MKMIGAKKGALAFTWDHILHCKVGLKNFLQTENTRLRSMFVQEPSTHSKQQHNTEGLELKNCKFGFDFISKAFLSTCEYVPLRNLLIMHAAKNCLFSVYCKG